MDKEKNTLGTEFDKRHYHAVVNNSGSSGILYQQSGTGVEDNTNIVEVVIRTIPYISMIVGGAFGASMEALETKAVKLQDTLIETVTNKMGELQDTSPEERPDSNKSDPMKTKEKVLNIQLGGPWSEFIELMGSQGRQAKVGKLQTLTYDDPPFTFGFLNNKLAWRESPSMFIHLNPIETESCAATLSK